MLGFLANLRDMKTSLTSGMILLFSFWIIFGNALSQVPADGSLTGNLRKFIEYLGQAGTLGVIVFLAYCVGMLVTSHHWINVLTVGRYKITESVAKGTENRLMDYIENLVDKLLPEAETEAVINALELKMPLSERIRVTSKTGLDGQRTELKPHVAAAVRSDIFDNINLLEIQLRSKREKAWDQYDKGVAEAEFRAGIAGPLFLLGGVLVARMFTEGPSQLLLILVTIGLTVTAACGLMIKAKNKRQEANEEIVNAVLVGDVDIVRISKLKNLGGQA